MKYGYARVSSKSQEKNYSLDTQKTRLLALGVPAENITLETGSSIDSSRPALNGLLDKLKGGDQLHVANLDRLSRSIRFTLELFWALEDRGVKLVADGVQYEGIMGLLALFILAFTAEQTLSNIKAKTRAGIDRAKANNLYKGKQSTMTAQMRKRLVECRKNGLTVNECVTLFRISKSTVLRQTAAYEEQQKEKKEK